MSEDLKNGAAIAVLGNIPVVTAAVEILEKVLIEARAGRCTSVGIVMIDPNGGVATPWAGPQIPQIYLAAGMMQARIIRSIEAPAQQSRIIPARNLG